jgi:lipopolysaccharide/colanic/teichoic acid biosynthesis glycosyltransferase
MTRFDMLSKRLFDLSMSFFGGLLLLPLIMICWLIASLETKSNGFFLQKRIGLHGQLFSVIKIKTMHPGKYSSSTITVSDDPRITISGYFFRKTKVDELPQLWNVLVGDMSLVGPRPDVPGYADKLDIDQKLILLSVRPGITGPASIKYSNEEELLAKQVDPKKFNDEILYPDKVKLNIDYILNWTFKNDIKIIFKTILG